MQAELARLQADMCQYGHQSKTESTRRLVTAFSIVTKIVIPTRIVLRLVVHGSLAWDDWLIIAAFVCCPWNGGWTILMPLQCTDTAAFYAALQGTSNTDSLRNTG